MYMRKTFEGTIRFTVRCQLEYDTQAMQNIEVVCLPVFWGYVSESVQHRAGSVGSSHLIWHQGTVCIKYETRSVERQYNIYALLLLWRNAI